MRLLCGKLNTCVCWFGGQMDVDGRVNWYSGSKSIWYERELVLSAIQVEGRASVCKCSLGVRS